VKAVAARKKFFFFFLSFFVFLFFFQADSDQELSDCAGESGRFPAAEQRWIGSAAAASASCAAALDGARLRMACARGVCRWAVVVYSGCAQHAPGH
jgi:hypothetical protein